MKNPTKKQKKLAQFLVDEDSDSGSPLFNKIFHRDSMLYGKLHMIITEGEYDWNRSDANRLNDLIRRLNDKTNGYIEENWNK